MKRRFSISRVLLVMACLASLVGGQVTRPQPAQVLETGEGFHGNEVRARNGETWLGLYVSKRGSELLESRIRIRRVEDAILDYEKQPPQKTGKSVSVDHAIEPVFLVKDAPMLKAGSVTTIFYQTSANPYSLLPGKITRLKLGKEEYQLQVVGSHPVEHE